MPLKENSPPQELAADGLGAPECTWHTARSTPKISQRIRVRQALLHYMRGVQWKRRAQRERQSLTVARPGHVLYNGTDPTVAAPPFPLSSSPPRQREAQRGGALQAGADRRRYKSDGNPRHGDGTAETRTRPVVRAALCLTHLCMNPAAVSLSFSLPVRFRRFEGGRTSGESSNRKSVPKGFPGNGPVVDPARPLRPGPQATHPKRSYKAGALQAPRMANDRRRGSTSQGMRCV